MDAGPVLAKVKVVMGQRKRQFMKLYEVTVVLEVTYQATNQYKNKGTNTVEDTSIIRTQFLK